MGYDMRYKWPWMGCHIFCMYFECMGGIISLGCNPYTGMPSIHAMDHQSYGSRFYSICKPPNHSQGGVDCDMMYQWTWMGCHPFSHILLMHMNDLISLECNPYTEMPSTQATDLPRCGHRTGKICKPPRNPHGGVGCDLRYK